MAKFKQEIDEKSLAKTFGVLAGVLYIIWLVLLSAGGQALVAWVYGIHFVSVPITMLSVTASMAITGLVAYVVCGAIVGWLLAAIWNWSLKQKQGAWTKVFKP